MKVLLSVIALAILSLSTLACAQPVPPTATPYPTYTPAPTYTPYPTATPLPTNTPQPTATPLPTPTPVPDSRVYQSNEDRFEVTIPVDWTVDAQKELEGDHYFTFPDAEGAAFIIPLEIGEVVPLSFMVQRSLDDFEGNLTFELLESKEIDANSWRSRFHAYITNNPCLSSEIEQVFNRVGGTVYVVWTAACPSYLEKRRDDIDQFHESFRAW